MPAAGASSHSNRPFGSVSASQSSGPLPRPWVAETTAPATDLPWASTTRPWSGRRGAS